MKGTGIIVDGFSTGTQLVAKMRSRGFDLVHVMSSTLVPESLRKSHRGEAYIDSIVFDGDADALVEKLASYAPRFVTPGTESGVNLSEAIAFRLGLATNDVSTIGQRSNKAGMGEALRRAGVPCAGQVVVDAARPLRGDEVDALGYPVVVKPTESAGSDEVLIAKTFAEACSHVERILGKINKIGRQNHEVIIQQFMDGQQYIVNSVSLDGAHCICEIWRDNRMRTSQGQVLYDHEYLIDLHEAVSQELISYTRACLDALGVRFGPVHSELMLTRDGPKLVEIGARCQGGILGDTVEQAIGNSHVTLTAALLDDPEEFRRIAGNLHYVPRILVAAMNSHVAGIVEQASYDQALRQLRSFAAVMSMPKVGDAVEVTKDLFTGIGAVYLVHDDFAVLSEDLSAIRRMEKEGRLLQVRPARSTLEGQIGAQESLLALDDTHRNTDGGCLRGVA